MSESDWGNLESRNAKVLRMAHHILMGDEHEIMESGINTLTIKLSDNNTDFEAKSLMYLVDSLQKEFDDKIGYVRIYSSHGDWILEIYFIT